MPAIQGVEAAIRDLIPKPNQPDDQRKEQREVRDLQAQEGMVFWAMWMLIATLGSVILTGVGIVLISRTLHYTKIAANHTEAMVYEAKETTKAALESARVALEQFQAGTPAKIHVNQVTVAVAANRPFEGRCLITNEGRAKADITRGTSHIVITDKPFPQVHPSWNGSRNEIPTHSIAPGEREWWDITNSTADTSLTETQFERLGIDWNVYFTGYILYKDDAGSHDHMFFFTYDRKSERWKRTSDEDFNRDY